MKLVTKFIFFKTMSSLNSEIVLQALSHNGEGPALPCWQYIEVTESADGQGTARPHISHPTFEAKFLCWGDRSICLQD